MDVYLVIMKLLRCIKSMIRIIVEDYVMMSSVEWLIFWGYIIDLDFYYWIGS